MFPHRYGPAACARRPVVRTGRRVAPWTPEWWFRLLGHAGRASTRPPRCCAPDWHGRLRTRGPYGVAAPGGPMRGPPGQRLRRIGRPTLWPAQGRAQRRHGRAKADARARRCDARARARGRNHVRDAGGPRL